MSAYDQELRSFDNELLKLAGVLDRWKDKPKPKPKGSGNLKIIGGTALAILAARMLREKIREREDAGAFRPGHSAKSLMGRKGSSVRPGATNSGTPRKRAPISSGRLTWI